MAFDMDRHRQTYREEAQELLLELESVLLELEQDPEDADKIACAFRALHTIKGGAGMFGFEAIAELAHELENLFDQVRAGILALDTELVNLALAAKDQIRIMLTTGEDDDAAQQILSGQLIELCRQFAHRHSEPESATDGDDGCFDSSETENHRERTYRIRFRPDREIFRTGTNPLSLLAELDEMGECLIVAQMDRLVPLEEMDPELCYTYWDIILTTARDENSIRDVFIFVEDDCELRIDVIDEGEDDAAVDYKRIGEILVERGDLTSTQLQEALQTQKPLGEILTQRGTISEDKLTSALLEQQHIRQMREKRQKTGEDPVSIRVPSHKLDRLVNLVGELVTVQARLSRTANNSNDPELLSIAEEVEHLTAELRDTAMNTRMMPIGSTFSRFKRLVRDLSRELGKDIELETEGADTELDKTVIDRLADPLVHLIRNCIDHGIEAPAVRESLGKTRAGRIHLAATHSGTEVIIEIRDDGRGLDPDALRQKGIERGLLTATDTISDKAAFQLVFEPGFSTAHEITNVSGRGVGMDVVQRTLESLGGNVTLHSRRGVGTTVVLALPLTLAIIEGLLVQIGDDHFVMPHAAVEECIELTSADIRRAHDRCVARIREEAVPYVRLRDYFEMSGSRPEIEQVVVTRANGQRVGFAVDQVIGGHQTVIKSLGKFYRDVREISGATILGDGSVALILDLGRIAQNAELEEIASFSVNKTEQRL